MPAKYRNPLYQWHRLGFTQDLQVANRKAQEYAPKFSKVKVKPSRKGKRKGYTVWFYGA